MLWDASPPAYVPYRARDRHDHALPIHAGAVAGLAVHEPDRSGGNHAVVVGLPGTPPPFTWGELWVVL